MNKVMKALGHQQTKGTVQRSENAGPLSQKKADKSRFPKQRLPGDSATLTYF